MAATATASRLHESATWEQMGAEWPSSQEKSLVCCRVIDETHDVRTFVFSGDDGLPFRFEPGQFITVAVDIDGMRVNRCYTISSPPTRPYTLSITVKRVPGGLVSNWLHDHVGPGTTLPAFGPSGVFTPVARASDKMLFLSAGSGVTPLMSMTRASADLGQALDIVFVHSARTPADIVFRQELTSLSRMCDQLRVVHLCEGIGHERDWSGPLGRLSLELLERFVPDFREREVFTCGPEGYMRGAREVLVHGGHDPQRHHQERFSFEQLPADDEPPATSEAAAAPHCSYTLRLAKSQKTLSIDVGQTVLSAVKKAGAAIATSCQQGICGSCKTLVLEGSVQMSHQGGIRQREIDKGLRLLCCSYPTSDLVLDL